MEWCTHAFVIDTSIWAEPLITHFDIGWEKYAYCVSFLGRIPAYAQMRELGYMEVLQIQMHTSKKYGETTCKHNSGKAYR
jgi:hypothetical protein